MLSAQSLQWVRATDCTVHFLNLVTRAHIEIKLPAHTLPTGGMILKEQAVTQLFFVSLTIHHDCYGAIVWKELVSNAAFFVSELESADYL